MKIDMSSRSITLRLKQASQLRRTCLALADSSVARRIREQYSHKKEVQRTSDALGLRPVELERNDGDGEGSWERP